MMSKRRCLYRFTRAVEGLLRISDYHRRQQLQAIKMARKLKYESSPTSRPFSVPEGDEAEEDEADNKDDTLSEREAERVPLNGRGTRGTEESYGCSPSQAFCDLPQVCSFFLLSLC